MIHKISDFDPGVIVVQVTDPQAKGQTVDLIDHEAADCFAFLRPGSIPMVVIDARQPKSTEVLRSLEARGVCAVHNWVGLEENMIEALELLYNFKEYSAAKEIEEERKSFKARKIKQISG